MDTIAHYRTERRPFDASLYDSYLQMYGRVYGDMSDPVKRADTVKALRRRDAMSLASACRELRAQVTATPTVELLHELKVKTYQIEECGHVRSWNIRNADIHMYRMIINELKRRGEI